MLKKIYHIDAGETEMYEIDAREAVAKFPDEWAEKPWPAKEKTADKPVNQPTPTPAAAGSEPKAPFEAKEKTAGWWGIFDADGNQVGKNMRADDAKAFNDLSEDDKAEYVKSEASQG